MRTQDLLCQALLWTIFHVVHGIICHQEPRLKSSAPENERKENCVWSQHTRPGDQPEVRLVLELLVWTQLIFLEKNKIKTVDSKGFTTSQIPCCKPWVKSLAIRLALILSARHTARDPSQDYK